MPAPITLPIGTTTLPVGTRVVGPSTIGAGFSEISLTLDRTVAGGFNATPTTVLSLEIDKSTDSGATWQELVAASIPGGVFFTKDADTGLFDVPVNVADVNVSLPGTAMQLRAQIVVTGAAVTVAGSLVIS